MQLCALLFTRIQLKMHSEKQFPQKTTSTFHLEAETHTWSSSLSFPPPSFLSTWLYCNRIWWMKGISACLFPIWSSFRCWCSQLIFHTKKKQKTKKRLISQPCSVACLLEVSICLQYVNVPFSSLCGPSQSQEDRALFAEHVFYFILLLVRKCHVTPLCVTRYWNVNCVRVRETTEHAVAWRNLLEE